MLYFTWTVHNGARQAPRPAPTASTAPRRQVAVATQMGRHLFACLPNSGRFGTKLAIVFGAWG